ncbi:MAG: tetratricopeptide repeat protein [Polyangiaceae bacterium]|nr:tetratricopeptide repeat protein [Polyangiaceae bacterium]
MDAPPDLLAALESARSEPHELAAWEDLEDIAARHELPEQVFELYREVLLGDQTPAALAEQLTQRATRFHDEWFDDPYPLAELLARLLRRIPDAGWAFERLTLLYTAKERWDELFALYDSVLAATTDVTRRRELLDEAAHAAKDLAARPDRAVTYLMELAPLRPADAQLAASLERLLEARHRHADLVKLWTLRLPALAPPVQAKTRLRIAGAWLEKLGDPGAALEAALPALDAADEPGGACELIERVGGAEGAPVDVRRRALDAVAARLELAGRGEDVARVLAARVPLLEPGAQAAAHRDVAARLLSLGREAESQDQEALALRRAPGDAGAREALIARATATGRVEEAVDALELAARAAEDGSARQELRRLAARLAEEQLAAPSRAAELYTLVFDDEDASPDARLEAGGRLDALLAEAGKTEELARVLGRLSEISPPDARVGLWMRKARLHEQLDAMDDALATYRGVVAASPGELGAHDAIVRILDAQSEHPALVQALRQRAALREGAGRRDDLAAAAALVAASGELDEAIEAWRAIEAELGRDDASIDALSLLYLQAGRADDLDALLAAAARETRDPMRQAELSSRRGDLARVTPGAEATAFAAYRDALDTYPEHEGAQRGLAALASTAVGRDAIAALVAALDRTENQAKKAALLETRLSLTGEPVEQAALLLEAAAIHEALGEPDRALDAAARAFALCPDDPSLESEAARLGQQTRGFARLERGYVEALSRDGLTRERRHALGVSLAELRDRDLGDLAGAIDALCAVTDEAPAHPRAAALLVSAACRASRAEVAARAIARALSADASLAGALFEVLGRDTPREALPQATSCLADAAGEGLDAAVRHTMLLEAARLMRDELGDRPGAERALTGAAEARPGDAATLLALADVRRDAPGQPLVDVLLALADLGGDDASHLEEAARVAQDALRDDARARPILERLLARASADPVSTPFVSRVLERLVAACRATGDARAAVTHVAYTCALPIATEAKIEWLYRGAELAESEVADAALAIQLLGAIVDLDLGERRAVEALAALLSRSGDDVARATLRERELPVAQDLARRVELRLDLAELRARAGAREPALAALAENLAESPAEPRTLDALKALLVGADDQRRLADLLLAEAERQPDGDAAAAIFADVARIADERLGDADLAIRSYRRVVEHHHDPAAVDALARLLLQAGSADAAAQLLAERLARATSDRADVALRLADALRRAGNTARARHVLEAATAEHPTDRDLRGTLADLYRAAKAYEPLVALLSSAAEREDEPETKVAMLLEIAETQQKRLARPADAISTLRAAQQTSPQDRAVRAALADALRSAGELDEARDILLALIEEFGRRRPAERAVLHLHLAAVSRERGDLDEALAQLDVAASMDMTHAGVLRMLGETAEEKGQLDRAERALRSLLMVVRRQKPEALSSPSAIGQAETLHALARLARKQGDEARAAELLETAFEVALGAPLEADALERALAAEGRHDLSLRLLSARRAAAAGTADEVPLALAIADALAGLGRPAEAVDELLSVLSQAAGDARAQATLRRAAREAGRSADAGGALRSLLSQVSGAERRAVAVALADLTAEDLGDAAGAAAVLRDALADPEAPPDLAEALLDRARAAGDVDAERAALEWLIDAPRPMVSSARSADALLSLAALLPSEDEAGVIDAVERAIERDARHRDAALLLLTRAERGSLALGEALERAARATDDAELQLRALDAVTARRLREGADASLLDTLREAADLLPDDPRVEAVLLRAIAVAEALPEGPREAVWAAARLTGRALSSGEVEDAARFAHIVALEESTEAQELVLSVASTTSAALPSEAARLFGVVLEREPSERRAYDGLLAILEATRDVDGRLSLLERTLEAVMDGGERQRLRTARARLLVELGRDDEAAEALRDVLSDDPDDVAAATTLADLFERHGRSDDLAELLERQLEGARMRRDAAVVSALTLRISPLLGERVDARRDLLEQSLEAAPDERPLLAALALHVGEGAPEWLALAERLLAVEATGEAPALALSLADRHRALDDRDAEARVLTLGLRRAPASDALFDRLARELAEATRFADLVDATLLRAAAEADLEAAVGRYRQASMIAREHARDPGGAVDALSKALARAPDEVSLVSEMVEILVEAGDLAGAEELVASALSGRTGRPRASVLRLKAWIALRQGAEAAAVADLEEAVALGDEDAREELKGALELATDGATRRGDTPGARAHTMRLLELLAVDDPARADERLAAWVQSEPRDQEAIDRLLARGEATRNPSLVVDAALRLVHLTNGDAQVEAALKLARAARSADRLGEARDAMEHAFRAHPGASALRDELRDLYETSGAMAELADILLADAEALEGAARFAARRRAGEALLRAGELGRAAETLEAALADKPGDHETTVHLADAWTASGQLDRATALIDAAVAAHKGRRSRELSVLQHRMARIAFAAGDRNVEMAWLNVALDADMQNGAAASELADVATELGQFELAQKALRAVTMLKSPGPMTKAMAYLRQGMIARHLGDPRRGVLLARKALSEDPHLEEARAFLQEQGEKV